MSSTDAVSPSVLPIVEQTRNDLVDFAERFVKSANKYGRDGADSFLGGYTEWLGGDFVDVMVKMPPMTWAELNDLTEELLNLCHAYLKDTTPENLDPILQFAERVRQLQL